MAHCAKYTRGAVGRLARHYERAKDADGEYVKFGNESIDISKSHLNENLAPKRNISQGEFIKQRCTELNARPQKTINVMCSWVVTLPKEYVGTELEKPFMQEAYNFLEDRYGSKNVVSAYVHRDETTPHLHFAFVPAVFDKKKKIEKLSAKELINRVELQKFHKDLDKHLRQNLRGYEGGILNDATKLGNRSIEELKAVEKEKDGIDFAIVEAQKELSELWKKSDNLDSSIEIKEKQLSEITREYEIKRDEKTRLDMELEAIQGGLSDITERYNEAKRLVAQKQALEASIAELKATQTKLNKEKNALESRLDYLRDVVPLRDSEIESLAGTKAFLSKNYVLTPEDRSKLLDRVYACQTAVAQRKRAEERASENWKQLVRAERNFREAVHVPWQVRKQEQEEQERLERKIELERERQELEQEKSPSRGGFGLGD